MTSGKPLQGRRIVVTRAPEQAAGLIKLLTSLAATVLEVPAIAIESMATAAEVRSAARRLRGRSLPRWLAVTSVNIAPALTHLQLPGDLEGIKVAAVGEASAAALRRRGLPVDLVASAAGGDALGADLVDAGAGAGSVWLPQAEAARPELARRLRAAGAAVEVTACYRTVAPADLAIRMDQALSSGVDAITVFSGSAARHVIAAVGGESLRGIPIICIGPATAAVVRQQGLEAVTAARASGSAVAAALVTVLPLRG